MAEANKEISILGCGWYGLELAKKLSSTDYQVKGSTTSPEKLGMLKEAGISPFLISFDESHENFDPDFFNAPLLLVCIPPKRSEAQQHTFLTKIRKIALAAAAGKVKELLFISSSSVYGDHNQEVDENTIPNPDTPSGKAMLEAEAHILNLPGIRGTIIRFAGLIGPDRDPGRFFAGKTAIPNGRAPVNLIHLKDCIGITTKILQEQAFGRTYNACNPDHPSRAQFYTAAAEKSGLALPQFNDELHSWKIVRSSNLSHEFSYTFETKLYSEPS